MTEYVNVNVLVELIENDNVTHATIECVSHVNREFLSDTPLFDYDYNGECELVWCMTDYGSYLGKRVSRTEHYLNGTISVVYEMGTVNYSVLSVTDYIPEWGV